MRTSAVTRLRLSIYCLALLLALLARASLALAQGGVGTINGTVTDPKGLAVPGTKVIVLDTDTGIARELVTTDAGDYTAPFLQPGHYQITATKDGFETFIRKDLLLSVGQTLTADIALTVG